jgi:hypothetical protein
MKIEFSDNEKVTVALKEPTPTVWELLIDIREMLILGKDFAYMSELCCEDVGEGFVSRRRFSSLGGLIYAAREKCEMAVNIMDTVFPPREQSANNIDGVNSSTTGDAK